MFLIFGTLRLFMMTTNSFVIAKVKQLRTDGSFRILLLFFRTSWCVGVLNSAIFKFSQSGWVWHDFGGPSEFQLGGVEPPSARHSSQPIPFTSTLTHHPAVLRYAVWYSVVTQPYCKPWTKQKPTHSGVTKPVNVTSFLTPPSNIINPLTPNDH